MVYVWTINAETLRRARKRASDKSALLGMTIDNFPDTLEKLL